MMNRRLLLAVAVASVCAHPMTAQPTSIRVVRDIAYTTERDAIANKHSLDLYVPTTRTPAPVIVSIYGGALMEGDKSEQPYVGQPFASSGMVTVVINYRLTPAVTHPAHIQDVAAAFAWVKRHIAEYGGNPNQIFVIGHSAGGYLTALLATDERYLAAQGLSLADIAGAAPVSGFFWVERKGVAPDRDKRVWGTDPKAWAAASPAHHLSAKVPPMLIVYADGDAAWRREQNEEIAGVLKAAGNMRVELVKIAGRDHGSVWERLNDDGDEVSRRIVSFVHQTLGPSQLR
jgi:acetyl esterase/lipase